MRKNIIDEVSVINDFKCGFCISKLQLKYGGSIKTLRNILFNANLIESNKPIRKKYFVGADNVQIKNDILLRYEDEKDLSKLSKEYNIPIMSIYNLLRKEQIYDNKYGRKIHHDKIRKYSLKERFFDNINSDEKAYFLGILYADGTNSTKNGEISLRLQEDDIEILEKLNNLIQPLKPIGYIMKKKNNHKNMRRLVINSKYMSKRLNEIGMMPNKTFVLKYPIWLCDDLHKHFIRGYFDGDGCVTFNKSNKQLCISFTGTEDMMLGIQNILISELDFYKTKLSDRHPNKYHNIRSLQYFGNGNSKKFYNFIYENTDIYMKRKKNKFEKYLKLN